MACHGGAGALATSPSVRQRPGTSSKRLTVRVQRPNGGADAPTGTTGSAMWKNESMIVTSYRPKHAVAVGPAVVRASWRPFMPGSMNRVRAISSVPACVEQRSLERFPAWIRLLACTLAVAPCWAQVPPKLPEDRLVMLTAKFDKTADYEASTQIGAGVIVGRGPSRLYIATADHVLRAGPRSASLVKAAFKDLPGGRSPRRSSTTPIPRSTSPC